MGAMPARRRRPDDPFLPPNGEGDAEAPELELPSRAKATVDITPPPRLAVPERQQPVKYKKPGTSWVTVVILGFAAVGMAAVGGTLLKKVLGAKDRTAESAVEEAKALRYSSLSKDDAVLVTVVVSPRDARLMLDGDHTVSNPLRFLRSTTRHKVSASAPGYVAAIQEVVPDASKTIRFTLKKQK
jgi:hypothetical protein